MESEIAGSWSGCSKVQNLGNIKNNLEITMIALKTWSKDKFRRVDKEMRKLRSRLEWLYKHNPHLHSAEIKFLTSRLD